MDPVGLLAPSKLRARLGRAKPGTGAVVARAVLDPAPLEAVIRASIPWPQLRRNIDEGHTLALMIAALQVRTGRTTVFRDLAPGMSLPPNMDRRRNVVPAEIGVEHVLASAAIPGLFPTRKIGDSYYCDGGVRFNTPIAPALRAGADRLLIIPLLGGREENAPPAREESPSLLFLFGKLLNALLLDPVDYDLAVLKRFNRLLAAMDHILDPSQRAEMDRVMSELRGTAYRQVQTLVFRPSQDLGCLAHDFASRLNRHHGPVWLLAELERLGSVADLDLLSFVLFDGEFAAELIRLAHADVAARADEVLAFFEVS
jgi:NTE family protein